MKIKEPLPVLFILMEFAPVNTTGNFRSLKFIKYLSQYGIQSTVVTFIAEEASQFYNARIDIDLLKELPEDTIIYRIHCKPEKKRIFQKLHNFLRIYFSIQDDLAKRWRTFLMKEIGAILKKHQPKLLFTSLPPFSSGLLTAEISKKFNIPLVTDMRDLWSDWGNGPMPSYLHYKLSLREEKKLYQTSAAVIYVTPQMLKTIQKINPEDDKNKYHLISNGFDKSIDIIKPFEFKNDKQKIIIGYVGAFYYYPELRDRLFKPWWKKRGRHILEYNHVQNDWKYRSPYFFFKTVGYLKKHHPEIANRIQIEFVGYKPTWMDSMLEEFDLNSNFISHGFVSHSDSIKLQERFDLFLATSEKIINDEHFCLPSKIFDYVGQNKPILGFVTNGIQKEFIEQSNLGVICNPDNTKDSANIIAELINTGKKFDPNIDYLSTFHRSNLSKKLADLFHSLK